jgi:hypothetical protein
MSNQFVRPDFSEYVVHFTKEKEPIHESKDERIQEIKKKTAKERLFSILNDKQIMATQMPWTNKRAVCFTECTWGSLFEHSNRYSRYGIGFKKSYLFSRGGAPAIYLSPGLWKHQEEYSEKEKHEKSGNIFADELFAFITPFCPPYASKKYQERFWKDEHGKIRKPIDFTHEREWRVPHNLDFELNDVAFVIIASYKDMAEAKKEFKDKIGRDNWLLMNNYEKVEEFWPTHKLPGSNKNDVNHLKKTP